MACGRPWTPTINEDFHIEHPEQLLEDQKHYERLLQAVERNRQEEQRR